MPRLDVVESRTKTVSCDGGDELGHPTIYLDISNKDGILCPYCSKHFVFSPGEQPIEGNFC